MPVSLSQNLVPGLHCELAQHYDKRLSAKPHTVFFFCWRYAVSECSFYCSCDYEVKQWKACEQNNNSNKTKKETHDSHNNWHCSMHDKAFDSSFTVVLKICSKVIIELENWRSRDMMFCLRHFLTLNYSCGYAVYILVKTWELQMFYFWWAFGCFATFKISLLVLHVCVVV